MLTHEQLVQAIPDALQSVDLPVAQRDRTAGPKTGKVRDIYRRRTASDF